MTEATWLADDAEFAELSYPLLHNTLTTEDGIVEFDSLNDTVIRSVGPSLGNFGLSLDALSIDVACDGLIVATPMGSTGYARAAGGSILPHSLPCLTVAPIAPFAPAGLRPIVCGDEACCRVHARQS
jgi:NAD+ kinase